MQIMATKLHQMLIFVNSEQFLLLSFFSSEYVQVNTMHIQEKQHIYLLKGLIPLTIGFLLLL